MRPISRYNFKGKRFKCDHPILSKEWTKEYRKWVKKTWPRANQEWTRAEDQKLRQIVKKLSSDGPNRKRDMKLAFQKAAKELERTYFACEGRYRLLSFCDCQETK